jgi:hypothetical protein
VPDALCNATEDAVQELGRMGIYLMDTANCVAWMAGAGPSSVAAA